MKELSSQARRIGKTITFVPTMGFFHDEIEGDVVIALVHMLGKRG